MKYEWKKCEKNLYGVKNAPVLVNVPRQNYIMINGKGNPNHADFSERVAALYSLAYGIKMGYKAKAAKDGASCDIDDYTVYPLEGVWRGGMQGSELIKENLEYTIMIRQPDFITSEMIDMALEKVKQKKPSPLFDEITFESMEDGLCIQILHIGPFDNEPESFRKMNEFAVQKELMRPHHWHREIYLNNANRVSANKLKTILRYEVMH